MKSIEMNIEDNNIYEIIVRSFSEQLKADETEVLSKWLKSSSSNANEYLDFQELWNTSSRFQLSSKIDVKAAYNKLKRVSGSERKKSAILLQISRIAAVFLLAVLFSVIYNKFLTEKPGYTNEPRTMQQIKAVYGTQSRVQLSDSTIVYLNSGSTLRFPESFKGMKTRNVELIGEGFFSVKKDASRPFIVSANNIKIKVLGTSFNIDAYPGNSFCTIALVEGVIQLNHNNTMDGGIKMEKSQVCFYNASENTFNIKHNVDLNKYIAWTEGKILFSNDNINAVIEKLESWYNVDIEMGDKNIEKFRFTGTFINEPLEQVLNILSLTSNMQYKIYSAQRTDNNTYTKRKIILKTKHL